ncbi:MAG TPA: hypothetical protein VG603_04515 [Chitinophagales bacterium]|nr:hypothetical protein [Chitinophagales bacterium]
MGRIKNLLRVILTRPLTGMAILVFITQGLFARTDSTANKGFFKKPDYYVDDEQDRIDGMDGAVDGWVDLGDSVESVFATKTYINLVDSIQTAVDQSSFDEVTKKAYRDIVYLQIHKVNFNSVYNIKRFYSFLKFLNGELNAIKQNRLYSYLVKSNILQAFRIVSVIKNEPCADSFFIYAAHYRPDLVFRNYELYSSKPWALHVLEETSKIAPVTVKRYFNPKDPIFLALKTSNDTVIKLIIAIKEKYARRSNAFTLIDGIMHGDYTMDQADAIGSDPKRFFQAMIKIRSRKNPLGEHSLEEDMAVYALKFVRVLNDLHNDRDEVRFASIEKFSAEELYSMMVYSEEEIFTSSFNGLFDRMMIKLGPVSGFDFLKQVGDNRFRTFIKMCAGYGKLKTFLQSMTPVYQQMLMIKFASGLEQYNDLSQAVEVADAFGSITDSLVLKILKGAIKYEYIKQSAAGNERGKIIYGLLSSLFVDRSISNQNWFASVSNQYAIPSFDHIANDKLFNRDSIDRWLIFFYDDEDGESSYSTFIQAFTDPNWAIADSGIYVIIKSKKGKQVNIYANKPKHEYDGQEKIESIFNIYDYEPNVMVHRGHSYYAYKTIEKVKDNTQIFVLGSCGGYHSISSIIERSPEVSIISSKQIGTRYVNNPMLKLLAENIRKGQDVEWQSLWANLDKSLEKNREAYERFLDYIPPHKNLGAIFIKTYNKLMEDQD